MTPRQRMIATLGREKPDQIPIAFSLRDELMVEVKRHYQVETDREVDAILGADLSRGVAVQTRWPDYEKRINGELNGPFGHISATVLHDERTFEDPWGVVQRVGTDGRYLQWICGPFVDTDDLDSFDWPGEASVVDDPDLAATVAQFKDQGYWVNGSCGVHPFKQAWHMRGFENFLCDYMSDPDWVQALYDRIVTYNIAVCRRSAAAGADMIQYWGDVAMQSQMIVPPDTWRRLDKPVWARIIDETRKVNPDVKFLFHSDGNVLPIIDDLIEVGFDVLNPLQPECLNPGLVKARWGDRITLDGGGSVQRTLPFGSLDDIRREIDFLMTTCAYNGGYMLRPSNVVGFDCPVQNVVTYLEMARDYDLSKLDGPPDVIPDPPPCMRVRAK
ncbi:MAG: uroporphyrinogen decarboxylase family protein [Phycisphaeraceae bacterium]|jgi:uroporphyrinogen decarboxylase|nr:uroporphyrinogen decarboxylase family protein [Phycisphaeraceae bacterium]